MFVFSRKENFTHLTFYYILPRFMTTDDLRIFFGSQQSRISNIFLSHNHYDHYVLLVRTFVEPDDLPGLENIYV